MVDVAVNENENFVGYGRTEEGGLTRDFCIGPTMLIKGIVEEVVEFLGLEIEVITLTDEDLKDFDWENNFDEFGMWEGYDTAFDCLEDATEMESPGDIQDSSYIWCSALIKAKGQYHIVTYDFFNDGLSSNLV